LNADYLVKDWQRRATDQAVTALSQHRPEYVVPKRCADAVVAGSKPMVALMMLEQ
jgi:hypothetical protein